MYIARNFENMYIAKRHVWILDCDILRNLFVDNSLVHYYV